MEKGYRKNDVNDAWKQLQEQSFDFANDVFEDLEEKTSNTGLELASDNW